MLLDVISVEARPDFTLRLSFENGETRFFDMKPLLAEKPFAKLADAGLFAGARIRFGTVAWPGGIDIAPETLYDLSTPADE